MTRPETVTVEHEGFQFEVSGDWEPPVPGKFYARNGDPGDPPEGGYFENYDIKFNEESILDLLSSETVDAILDKAGDAVTD
ncbi:MAG: hypothetical protein ACOYM2_17140 [Rectinemataceae bacterium]